MTLITPEWYDKLANLSYLGDDWQSGFIDYENQVYYDRQVGLLNSQKV